MRDLTEKLRRKAVKDLAEQVESNDPELERKRLEAIHKKVWNTEQLREDFDVIGFMAPFCIVTRKADGAKGSLVFHHKPRFYFSFQKE